MRFFNQAISGLSNAFILVILTTLFISAQDRLIGCDEVETEPETLGAIDHSSQVADPDYIKRTLKELVIRTIDSDKDGYVSYEEMKSYLAKLHEDSIKFNVNKQWISYSPQIHEVFSWEGYEPEKVEVLTWDHYFNQTYPELNGIDIGIPINREQDTSRILSSTEEPKKEETSTSTQATKEAENETEHEKHLKSLKIMAERADRRWKLADENGDTLLTKEEFKFLLHPDEGNEALKELFLKEATEDMDINSDGKICLEEFMKHLQVLASDQEKDDQAWLSNQQENFGRFLDKNKDGILEGDEIKDWLVPARTKMFESEAKRLFDIGDTNEDHRLSTAEFLQQYDQFLSLFPPEYWQSDASVEQDSAGDAVQSPDVIHDEL